MTPDAEVLDGTRKDMEKTIGAFKKELSHIRTGRRGLSSRSATAGGCPHEQPNAAGHDGEI